MVYYGERIQNKMNLGKNYQVKVQESMKLRASSCPLLAKSRTAWLSLHWCLVIYMEYCQPGSSPKSWCPHFFIEASSHNHNWLTTWIISISRPSGNQSNTVWPKAPTPNHIVIHLIFPRQQANKDTTFQGFRDYLQKPRASARSLFGHTENYTDGWLFTLYCKLCVSPTMEMRSLRSDTRQHAVLWWWMNERVNDFLYVWCASSARYSSLKCLGPGNRVLLNIFEEHGFFKKVFILSAEKSPEKYCSKASLLYALGDNAFKNILDFRRT